VTPSVLVDERIVFSWRLPTVEEMKNILSNLK
jgi:hypothetical protein